jgi:hypothetical protein
MAFQAMEEMILRNEKKQGKLDERIYCWQSYVTSHIRITTAEEVVLLNYGLDGVAQLFGVDDLNGHIDPNTNGSEVEGGLFTEELVTRYPLRVIKCNSLRGAIVGEGLPVGCAPQRPFLKMCLNGKFFFLSLIRLFGFSVFTYYNSTLLRCMDVLKANI